MFPLPQASMGTGLPVGSVITYAGNIAALPDGVPGQYTIVPETLGFMLCDGRELATASYPELFQALGWLYGGNSTTFYLPDLRGVFLRGVGTDNASTENRTAPPNGTVTTGVGTGQSFAVQTHQHLYTMPDNPLAVTQGDGPSANVVEQNTAQTLSSTPTNSTSPPGDVSVSAYETRPANVFVYFLIKYTLRLPQVPAWTPGLPQPNPFINLQP